MDKGNIIGVDLGGTNIRVGKVSDDRILTISKAKTPSKGSEIEVLDKIYNLIAKCLDHETRGIGVGVPSVVDTKKGIVYDVVNIPSWKEVPLQGLLEQKFKLPVIINNDSNCFVAGERKYGKAKDYRNVVGMTIGTGIGLGLIINGKLYEGRNCGAGEIGMLPYLNSNYEAFCSGQFFSRMTSEDPANLFLLAQKGDQNALALYHEFGKNIGVLLKTILYAYDPEIIVVGGSFSKAFEYLKEKINTELADFIYGNTLRNIKIEISEIEESAILGAAALLLNTDLLD
jgi:glucokinase